MQDICSWLLSGLVGLLVDCRLISCFISQVFAFEKHELDFSVFVFRSRKERCSYLSMLREQ